MFLEKFLNEHDNWREILRGAPYFIDTKQDGDYFILKYNLGESDFNSPLVREARGSIFRRNEDGIWFCVCRAFDKFGNYGESYADTPYMEWENGVDVQEKIDGSLIKVWFDRGTWHISTSGIINAFKASCGETSFGALFAALVNWGPDFYNFLDTNCCYFFELVCPTYNRLVVRYKENAVYFLGCRNMQTMEEVQAGYIPNVRYPRHFTYHSLKECVEAAQRMGEDEEGYVCVSKNMVNGSYLRIKVKGDEYLRLFHLRGNVITISRVVKMWQDDKLDDFLAAFPEYKEFVDKVLDVIRKFAVTAEDAFRESLYYNNNRKQFAIYASMYEKTITSYLFAALDGRATSAIDYLKNMLTGSLIEYVKAKIPEAENDDEG